MTKAFNEGSAAQNKNVHGPKTLGEIINDMLRSDSPLAVAYRDHAATLYPDTELGVDLKLLTRQTGRMGIGQYKRGMLTRDAEDHYLFVENDTGGKRQTAARRNRYVYVGRCVNVKRKPDGKLFTTFNRPPLTPEFTFRLFCLAAAEELLTIARRIG